MFPIGKEGIMLGYKILIKGITEEELAEVKKLCAKRGWPFSVTRSVLPQATACARQPRK